MEFLLLAKVGVAIDWVVRAGYTIAGIYVAKTGVQYVKDYRHFVEQEKAEVR